MNSSAAKLSNDVPRRIAVVGGGISGLAAAHRLGELCRESGRPVSLSVIEGGSRLGGVVETRTVGEYIVEVSADSFITDKPWAMQLCRRLGLDEELTAINSRFRRSLVLHRGRAVEVPEGFTLMAPAKLWPVITSPIFNPWGKLRLGLEYLIPARRDDADESIACFVRRRLGRQAWERLVQPLVGGIYTSDPEDLSLLATLPRFREMEHTHGSLIRASRRHARHCIVDKQATSGARYGLFATLKGGLSDVVECLQRRISEFGAVRLNTQVSSIQTAAENGRWEIQLGDGSSERFDGVILAVRSYQAAALTSGVDADLAELLGRIEYASSAVVVSGHKLADVAHPLDAFGLVIPRIEKRRILAVSFTSRKFAGRAPPGCVQLRTFVGGATQPEMLEKSDGELIAVVRSELEEILGVRGREDFALVARYERAMPQYQVGHLELIDEIERRVAKHAGLELAGNAYRGVGLPDCIHSGEQAAERLVNQIASSSPSGCR